MSQPSERPRRKKLGGRNRPTHPRRLLAAVNAKRAMEMRIQGHSLHEIGEALGVKKSAAGDAVKRGLIEFRADVERSAGELRALEIARLERMLVKLDTAIEKGDEKAIDRAIKIGERRAKLLGLDAPTKVAPTNPDGSKEYAPPAPGATVAEVADRVAELLARAQRRRSDKGKGKG